MVVIEVLSILCRGRCKSNVWCDKDRPLKSVVQIKFQMFQIQWKQIKTAPEVQRGFCMLF